MNDQQANARAAGSRGRRDCHCRRARHVHGTAAAYDKDKCGCAACRAANAAREAVRFKVRHLQRSGLAPQTWTSCVGTRRRLQALAVLGWTTREIGALLGVTGEAVEHLRRREGRMLHVTAERVAEVYDTLSMRSPGPWTWRRSKVRNAAIRRGWVPPLAWDDDTIDDPAARPQHKVRGRHVATERAEERLEQVARLSTLRMSVPQIADRLAVDRRTVSRDIARMRGVA